MEQHSMKVIAHIRSDFSTKFGIPRQSGLVTALHSEIIFEPEFRSSDALRGIEDFSHLWLIWQFSAAVREGFSPTVRPPRLGGNTRMGVFATRSPFRPNPIGLSCVRLVGVKQTDDGPVLTVAGADMMDGTPIYDIKPYLPYADCQTDAVGGFAAERSPELAVEADAALLETLESRTRQALLGVLAQDPRPHYQDDATRIYGMDFAGHNVRFRVEGDTVHLLSIEKL